MTINATDSGVIDGPDVWQPLFVLARDPLFMDVGTTGSPPREVLQTMQILHREVAEGALSAYHETFDDLRERIGGGLGCDTDELFLSASTTDGLGTVLSGLSLEVGDEVLTTNHEHTAADIPLAVLAQRRGVSTRRVDLPVGNEQTAEDYVELFENAITSRTKVMLFSAPTYRTGTMLPIRLLAELAQRHNLITVVDGAHIPGQYAYRFRELGVDFLAGSGAKWQCGPERTGLLYIRNRVLPQFNANPLADFWPTISSAEIYPSDGLGRRDAGTIGAYDIVKFLQDAGNPSLSQVHGLAKACEVWDRIGRERIERHALGLATHLKNEIAERWGVDALYSPLKDRRLHSALTAFNPFGDRTDILDEDRTAEFVDRMLSDHHIVVRSTVVPVGGSQAPHHAVRISTHLFHTQDDVDRVVKAAWKLSRAMTS